MANSNKCGTCGGVLSAKPVDTSQFPSGSLQPVSNACSCGTSCPSTQNNDVPLAKSCPPKCAPSCATVTPCEEDHTQEIIINNFSTTVKTSDSFNFPAVGGQAQVKVVNVQSLIPGQILYAQGIGRLHVVSYDAETRVVTLTNLGDSCDANPASPGQLIPACTEFAVGIPECDAGGSGVITAGPFLAADMTAPGNGNCATIKVTTIIGLAINDVVSIATFQYRIDEIIDTETIKVCDDGDGATVGQVIEWDANNDNVPDVPIIPISGDNPCAKAPISMGVIVACDDAGQLTTLQGSQTGQVPVWDEDLEKFTFVTLNLENQCTFLTACFSVDIGDDGPYLVTVDDTGLFEEDQQVRIDGDLFTIDEIVDGTHMRLIPDTTPGAIKEYEEGLQVCLRDCCEYIPQIINNPCYPAGVVALDGEPINLQIGPPGDIIAGMANRYYTNPLNPIAIAPYTNNTECTVVQEVFLSIAQSVIWDNVNTTAVSEISLGTVADQDSVMPRVIHEFTRESRSTGVPPQGFIQSVTSSNWQEMAWHSGTMRRRITLAPGQSSDWRLRHFIVFDSPNNPAPPPGTANYFIFVHGDTTLYRV